MSLWPLAFGVGSVAVAAGALSVPAARRLTLGDVNFDWLGRELEFDRIEPDGFTVRLKSGSAMRAFRLGGVAYDTKPESEQMALHQGRADFLHAASSRGVAVRLFGVKRRRETLLDAVWPSPALQEIGDREAELYRQAYEVRWYMTLSGSAMHEVEEADEKAHSLLSTYRPKRLVRPHDKEESCPLTGFINYLACGDLRDDLLAVSSVISANVQSADHDWDKRTGHLTLYQPEETHYRTIAVKEWPDLVSGHLMHELAALPGELEINQIVVPMRKEIALALLKRGQSDPFGPAQAAAEHAAAYELLMEGKTSLASTQLSIVIRGRSVAELDRMSLLVTRVLGNRRIKYSVETKGAPVVWFNRLPDRNKLLRPLKLYSENVAALWPLESAPVGLPNSAFGQGPVRTFTTGSGQAYAFQFQCTDKPKALGHYIVFAPSGSGKSTIITHMLSGLAKWAGVRSFIFDSKEGTRFMVEAMGGRYQSFDRLALNPLDCDDTPINRQRLAMLIRLMMGVAGDDVAENLDDTITHAIENTFELPLDGVKGRTLNEIFQASFNNNEQARRAMSRWVTDRKGQSGMYAGVFNARRDSLSGFLDQSFMTGINMNEALEDPNLGAAVVAHIAGGIERLAMRGGSKGFAIFIDEAANLLRNPAFRDLAAIMFREYRKLGGVVGMAFQDPGALLASGIASAVMENVATLIFFPNPQGKREAYQNFNLNDEQLGFIFGAPEGRKVLLVKRDPATGFEESVILDVDLAPLGHALRFYKSGPDAVRELQEIQAKWGAEWQSHF